MNALLSNPATNILVWVGLVLVEFVICFAFRKRLYTLWGRGTLAQHKAFALSIPISFIVFAALCAYQLYRVSGDINAAPPLWFAILLLLYFFFIIASVFITAPRAKRAKKIQAQLEFRAMLKQKRLAETVTTPPPAPPTTQEKVAELIKNSRR